MDIVSGAARTFLRNPSFSTAEALLDELHIPVPYRNPVLQDLEQRPVKRARQSGGNHANTIKNLSRIDLLHDIGNGSAIRERLVTTILADTSLSIAAKQAITKECVRGRGPRTPQLLKAVYNTPVNKVRLHSTANKFTVAQDSELYTTVQRWYQYYRGREMSVILDGIMEGFVKRDKTKEDDTDTITTDKRRATRSLAICAFVLILLGKHTASPAQFGEQVLSSPSSATPFATSIRFLSGSFQKIDLPHYNRFMKKWVTEFGQRVTHIIIDAPTPFDNRIKVYRDYISYNDNIRIPLMGPRWTAISQPTEKTNLDLVNEISARMCMNYTKNELSTVFKEFLAPLTPLELEAQTPFIHRVCDINFFRDAYKAEAAVQTDAVYITFDRIASAYHSIINKSRAAIPGMFITLDEQGLEYEFT